MGTQLNGKRVAILATNGFEQSELIEPKRLLEEAGAETVVVSPEQGQIKGWREKDWGDTIPVDQSLDGANEADFDALFIPGGNMNPDSLRMNPKAVSLVKSFVESGKPVGAICHGPWLLAEADVIEGRHVTSWPSIKTDLINAGADWTDEQVVTDQGIVTSRKPADIPAFAKKLIEEINEGVHSR
jgi:protease I